MQRCCMHTADGRGGAPSTACTHHHCCCRSDDISQLRLGLLAHSTWEAQPSELQLLHIAQVGLPGALMQHLCAGRAAAVWIPRLHLLIPSPCAACAPRRKAARPTSWATRCGPRCGAPRAARALRRRGAGPAGRVRHLQLGPASPGADQVWRAGLRGAAVGRLQRHPARAVQPTPAPVHRALLTHPCMPLLAPGWMTSAWARSTCCGAIAAAAWGPWPTTSWLP